MSNLVEKINHRYDSSDIEGKIQGELKQYQKLKEKFENEAK